MRTILLFLLLVKFLGTLGAQTPSPAPKTPAPETDPNLDASPELAKVRRVYVDLLAGGQSAIKLRDLIFASLQSAHVFLLTENEEKADAVLKGTGEDSVFTEKFSSTDNLNAHTQIATPATNNSGGRYSNRASLGLSVGENESEHTEERKHEAMATLRLVTKNGDVIWSTTQESLGGKFLGAAADVADKVAKKLAADVRRARGGKEKPQ